MSESGKIQHPEEVENIETLLSQEQEFTKAVVGYLVEGDQIFLGLRKKVSNNLGENLIAGIGGKLEDDETDEDALIREIEEEIGVKVTSFKDMGRVRFLFPHKPSWQQDVRIFVVFEWQGDPVESEAMKPELFSQKNIPFNRMWDDNSYWLPKVLQGKRIDAVYLYDESGKVVEEMIELVD